MSDPTRVAAGLKAAVHNPNVSEEARERAEDRLQGLGTDTGERRSTRGAGSEGVETNRQLGGYKATLSNPNTSQEAKERAQDVLESSEPGAYPSEGSDETHRGRVLAGHKATLARGNVSDEAKEHSRNVLEENDAI